MRSSMTLHVVMTPGARRCFAAMAPRARKAAIRTVMIALAALAPACDAEVEIDGGQTPGTKPTDEPEDSEASPPPPSAELRVRAWLPTAATGSPAAVTPTDAETDKPKSAAPECAKDADCPDTAQGCIRNACKLTSGTMRCVPVDFVCVCLPGEDATCDDNKACTDDVCNAQGECDHPIAKACDDGNSCTTGGCNDDGSCAAVSLINQACDDGNACTAAETCASGACVVGQAVDCDDADKCTVDLCLPSTGCTHVAAPGKECA